MESTCTSKERLTEGTGHMTSRKDEGWSSGLMVPGMMESIRTTRSMGLVLSHGLTVLLMKESFRRTTFRDRALTSGLTTDSTLAIGTTTRCMVTASSVGEKVCWLDDGLNGMLSNATSLIFVLLFAKRLC